MKACIAALAVILCASLPCRLGAQQTQYEDIEKTKDISGTCQMDELHTTGCCGMPGVRACSNGFSCTFPPDGNTAKRDSYSGLIVCTIPGPSCSPEFAARQAQLANPNGPLDVTFYVTSDVHIFRGAWRLADSARHVRMMNKYYSLGNNWPSGIGFPATRIPPPLGVAIAGDLSNNGGSGAMDGFRMLYEENMIQDSIQYPVFVGLGNHDVISPDNSERNRYSDYVQKRMSCAVTNLDPVTKSYSWDWNRLHIVQLNMAASFPFYVANPLDPKAFVTISAIDWLKADLAANVGNSGKPVILIQHLGCDAFSIGDSDTDAITTCTSDDLASQPWWTKSDRLALMNAVQPYNVIALLSGHTHRVGVYRAWEFSDLHGNYVNRLDNFVNGAGGMNDDPSDKNAYPGHGEFFVIHVTDSYLDVLPVRWDDEGSSGQAITDSEREDQSTDTSRLLPNAQIDSSLLFKFGKTGCRKRIGDRFAVVPSDLYSLTPLGGTSVRLTNTSGAPIPGPLAIRVLGQSSTISFVDSCVRQDSDGMFPMHVDRAYVTNPGLDLPLDQPIAPGGSVVVDLGQTFDPANTELIALPPIQGASKDSVTVTIAPQDRNKSTGSITFYGPPQTLFTAGVTGDEGLGWLSVTPSIGNFDVFGRGVVTYMLDPAKLPAQDSGSLTITIQVRLFCPDNPGSCTDALGPYQRAVGFTVDFKNTVTVGLTANPPSRVSSPPPAPGPLFTAKLTYNPVVNTQLQTRATPGGEVDLYEISVDGKTRTLLCGAILNAGTPDSGNFQAQPYPQDSAVFGDSATHDGYYPPCKQGNSAWTFNLPVGLHRLLAHYAGSGNGDANFQPGDSPVLLYRVGAAAASMRSLLPIPYLTGPNLPFDNPLFFRVFDANGNGLNGVPITVTMPSTGASAGFPQATTWSTYTDINGLTSTPIPMANGIAGTYSVTAAVTEAGSTVTAQAALTNAALTGPAPAITAAIVNKQTSGAARAWSILLKNAGGPAYAVRITNVTLTQETTGATCPTQVQTSLPLAVPSMPTTGSASSGTVNIAFGCGPATRFTATIAFSANGGAYTGQTVIGHQFQ